ncbi:hypothetical protein COU16_02230 [Candidatus Kaiserbacteria bacterium CG10_big_fil_rev_8_21_14_0_10_47_16]|uniref:Uncharacterized protein n=1 Tax=Candidatus Kaiserbacteria bacterium CG10_big_fil_rev_8_21_14_0_10_47_16 TaxID=1974608 RepID=A0A2H0UF33_9BACT|nr:MAG: hypothetical protein COU16_02230 [Candidatus Kaiserbacteria bacterium CG10_big_fil_rev_8_21_14_0_10_47_16]
MQGRKIVFAYREYAMWIMVILLFAGVFLFLIVGAVLTSWNKKLHRKYFHAFWLPLMLTVSPCLGIASGIGFTLVGQPAHILVALTFLPIFGSIVAE